MLTPPLSARGDTFRRTRLAGAIITALPLLLSSEVFGLGLGQVEVRSHLGQPLDAIVPIHESAAERDRNETLTAEVPGYWDVQALGFDKPVGTDGLSARVVRSSDGARHVSLTTRTPVKEPLLSFVVRLSTLDQQLTREIGFFLDPQGYSAANVAATPVETAREPQLSPETGVYGPVRSGETLFNIARRNYPQYSGDLSVITDLVFETNIAAFLANDPDRLLAGSTLVLPDTASIEARIAQASAGAQASLPTPTTAPAVDVGETYGPVKAGDTLYNIARQVSEHTTQPIDAVMRDIVAANPHAFVDGNPDLLLAGATLKLATASPAVAATADTPAETAAPAVTASTEQSTVSTPEQTSEQLQTTTSSPSTQAVAEQIAQSRLDLEAGKQLGAEIESHLGVLNDKIELLQTSITNQDNALANLTSRIAALQAATATLGQPASGETQPSLTNDAAQTEAPAVVESAQANAETTSARQTPGNGLLDVATISPTLIGAVLGGLLLIGGLSWYLRYRSQRAAQRYLDHRDKDASDAQHRLAKLRDSYDRGELPLDQTLQDVDVQESFVVTPGPATTPIEAPAAAVPVSARGLAMEAAASLAWDDFDTAKDKIDQAIAMEPENQEHQLTLLRILDSAGRSEEVKKVGDSMLADSDKLTAEMRAQIERIYQATG